MVYERSVRRPISGEARAVQQLVFFLFELFGEKDHNALKSLNF